MKYWVKRFNANLWFFNKRPVRTTNEMTQFADGDTAKRTAEELRALLNAQKTT